MLDQKPRALRKPEKHLQEIEAWADGFVGFFPAEGRSVEHWHLPADQRLVDPPTTTPAYQARCAQALINVARHLVEARPARQVHARVFAAIFSPDMFMSEVDVFFDQTSFRSFERRDSDAHRWTRLPPDRSLIRELGLKAPNGFTERGYHQSITNDDPEDGPSVFENEVWIIGEGP